MPGDAYLEYLGRFEAHVGAIAVGAYGKFHGKLVRKLSAEEFTVKHGELTKLAKTYQTILERGDTLNDALTKLLRERQIELLLEPQ
ncbi:MAG TPA: hypothetical protein VFF06_13340 [Polyangia bacterium]|nr:hypothetical protein [Polyangia bacterium]